MKEYTINLTDAQDLALSYVAATQKEWINNVIENRCRLAMDEITQICVDRCLAENIQIPGSKDDIVLLAFRKGWVRSANQTHIESQASMVYS